MIDGNPDHGDAAIPATFFAPPERATRRQLRRSIDTLVDNPLLHAALTMLGGWVAVLNQNRQILAVNHAFLHALGVDDPAGVLGLRPGEALHCAHAADHPGGCGTSRFCATCGAVICILAAQKTGDPQERECVLTAERDGIRQDRAFAVSCSPFQMGAEQLLLICMRDISDEKRRVLLERTFLHDIGNLLTALDGAAHLLERARGANRADLIQQVRQAADTLIREVTFQRLLCRDDLRACPLDIESVQPSEILKRLDHVVAQHPAARSQVLCLEWPENDEPFETDVGLLLRVLVNMAVNAFEAGRADDQVRISAETTADSVIFRVWNRQPIPEDASLRIFQRYYSTKPGPGRGLGTFGMKLIGETLLKGEVSFSTSPSAGTTFRISLSRHPSKADDPARPRSQN